MMSRPNIGFVSVSNLNRVSGWSQRRYNLGHFVAQQLTDAQTTPESLEALGLLAQAGCLAPGGSGGLEAFAGMGGGVGGTSEHIDPRGVYPCTHVGVLQNLQNFIEIPLTIKVLVSLRRLFNEPIDVMLGLEHLPVIYGGSKIIRLSRRMEQRELTKRTKSNHSSLHIIDKFSQWASDNQAGNIATPPEWINEQLNKYSFGWGILIKMREILESNIDDIIGMSYR